MYEHACELTRKHTVFSASRAHLRCATSAPTAATSVTFVKSKISLDSTERSAFRTAATHRLCEEIGEPLHPVHQSRPRPVQQRVIYHVHLFLLHRGHIAPSLALQHL